MKDKRAIFGRLNSRWLEQKAEPPKLSFADFDSIGISRINKISTSGIF